MVTVAELDRHVAEIFSARLEREGFTMVKKRKWVRARKAPIREFFWIQPIRIRHSPVWGISTGLVPNEGNRRFSQPKRDGTRQPDLIIDVIDPTGRVPEQTFSFLTGHDTRIPISDIRACADYFVPKALADFSRVSSLQEFCELFDERRRRNYVRFQFHNYTRHNLASGFVKILQGSTTAGVEEIERYCDDNQILPNDRVIRAAIEKTMETARTLHHRT